MIRPNNRSTRNGSSAWRDAALQRTGQWLLVATLLTACSRWPTATTTTPAAPLEPARLLPLPALPDDVPAAPQFGALELPAQHGDTLANGIRLVQLPSTRAPYVRVQLTIDAGRMSLGADADVLAEMLRLIGSADTPAQWQQQWRQLASSLSVQSGPHRLVFSAEVLPAQQPQLLTTLLQMWRQPNLGSADTLALAKRNLRVQQHEQDLLGDDYRRLWRRLAYGPQHPYGAQALTRDALQAVTLASLQQSWQQAQREPQLWLLAGAVTAAARSNWRARLAAQPAVATEAGWRQRRELPNALPQAPSNTPAQAADSTLHLHLLDADDAAQVNVIAGYALALPDAATQWTCTAFADLLGLSFSGRLFADLRSRRGLSYDPTAYCSPAPLASELVLTGSARPAQAIAFVHGLLDHLRLLREQAPSTDELQLIRNALRGQSRQQLETARQRSRLFTVLDLLGQTWPQLQQRDRHWQQLSVDDVHQFSATWLHGQPVVVVRGDARFLRRHLQQAFPNAAITVHRDVAE